MRGPFRFLPIVILSISVFLLVRCGNESEKPINAPSQPLLSASPQWRLDWLECGDTLALYTEKGIGRGESISEFVIDNEGSCAVRIVTDRAASLEVAAGNTIHVVTTLREGDGVRVTCAGEGDQQPCKLRWIQDHALKDMFTNHGAKRAIVPFFENLTSPSSTRNARVRYRIANQGKGSVSVRLNGKSVDDVPVGEESEIDEIVSSGQRLVVTTEADDGLKVVFQRKAFNLGYGNGKGDDGGGNDGGDEVTGVISPLGGQVIVPGLCSVTFPPGAFAAPTEVKVSVLRDASLFVADDITYSTVSRYIVPGITVTLASPMSANIEAVASFNVPDSLAGLESRISLLGRVVQSGSEESLSTQTLLLPQEQIVRQRTQAALGTVTGRLPSWAFSGPDPGSNIIDIILALRDEFPASSGSYPCYGAELTAPLSDPLFASKISSAFGPRVLPGSPTVHLGVDFGVPLGTPVYAADQGEVVAVNQNSPSAGKIVVVQHAHGFTRYLHLSEIYADMNHRTVPPNGIIGLSGRLGLTSTGAHLHFEYMPFGLLFETGTSPQFLSTDRVDPMACMARPAQGARIEILNFDFLMRLGDSRSLSAELRVPPNKVVGRDIFVWSAGVLPSQPGPVLSITSGGVVTAVGEGFGFAQAELRGSNSVTRNIVFPRQLFAHVDAFWGRYLGRAVVSGGTGYDGEYDFGMSFRENYTYEGGWGMQGHDLFLGYPLYSTKRVGNTIDFLWGDSGPPEQRSGTVTLVGDDISGSVKWLGGTVTFQAHYAGPIRASAEE